MEMRDETGGIYCLGVVEHEGDVVLIIIVTLMIVMIWRD